MLVSPPVWFVQTQEHDELICMHQERKHCPKLEVFMLTVASKMLQQRPRYSYQVISLFNNPKVPTSFQNKIQTTLLSLELTIDFTF